MNFLLQIAGSNILDLLFLVLNQRKPVFSPLPLLRTNQNLLNYECVDYASERSFTTMLVSLLSFARFDRKKSRNCLKEIEPTFLCEAFRRAFKFYVVENRKHDKSYERLCCRVYLFPYDWLHLLYTLQQVNHVRHTRTRSQGIHCLLNES